MSNLFTSSGGVGDLLIVGAKLSKLLTVPKLRPPVELYHFEKHEIQKKALEELMEKYAWMGLVSPKSRVFICDKPYANAISLVGVEECYPSKDQYDINGGYVSTYCNNEMNEFFYIPSPSSNRFPSPYIVINCIAGRTNDSTRRAIGAGAIEQLRKIAPKMNIVCISSTGEFPQVPDIICVKTPTIIHAFAEINECSGFVGQDGALAYYAMMRKKPTFISFHLKDLPGHYMHPNWESRSIVNIGSNIVPEIPPNLLGRFQKMLENPA